MNNDEIVRDARDVGDTKTTENEGDGGDIGDVGETENAGDDRDAGNARDKEAGRGNKGGEQEDAEVSNNEGDDSEDWEVDKVGYNGVDDGVGDGVGVGKVLEDIELGNDGVSDSTGNQDNQHVTVKDAEDSDNIVVDPIDRVLADILTHPFVPCHSNPTRRLV